MQNIYCLINDRVLRLLEFAAYDNTSTKYGKYLSKNLKREIPWKIEDKVLNCSNVLTLPIS